MSNPLVKVEVEADGRVSYTVAGMVKTYDAQEAEDFTQTGIFKLSDELTRSLAKTGPEAEYGHRYSDERCGFEVVRVK